MCAGTKQHLLGPRTHELQAGGGSPRAFTLVELLVVIGIVSVLMGILLPALGAVRRQARAIVGMSNQRQIVGAVNCYAADNDDSYPVSVATIAMWPQFSWQEPMRLIGHQKRTPEVHRSMSAYLRSYISDASVFSCPSAPDEHRYLQQAWDAGEDWCNPDMPLIKGPLTGTYCFYWNYTGYLVEEQVVFNGPSGPMGRRGQSKLVVSCYFGYDHYRNRTVYGSCEKFGGAGVTEETWMDSAWWSGGSSDDGPDSIEIKPRAAYMDGHVESYSSSDVVPMDVIKDPLTNEPFERGIGVGPGVFFLPHAALY